MKSWDVYFMKPDYVQNGIIGHAWCKENNCLPDRRALGKTHAYLKMVEAEGLNDLFNKMQGEQWSPNGEARKLIEEKGLNHTSMSTGDVVIDEEGTVWMVDLIGWKTLT